MLSFFQASCVIWNRRVIRTKRSTTAVKMIYVHTQWIVCTRSHNRSRRSQARGLRGSIEIANCTIFRTNCATPTSQTRAGTRKFARLSCGISEMGDRFATLFECSRNFPRAQYPDIQCMHSERMSQYYLHLFRERLSQKWTRQSRKVLWVVLSSLFFKEIWKNGMRGHGRMFASAKGKHWKLVWKL